MPKAAVMIKSNGSGAIKLSPAPFLPAMGFELSNQTGVDIKVIVDGKKIRIEVESS